MHIERNSTTSTNRPDYKFQLQNNNHCGIERKMEGVGKGIVCVTGGTGFLASWMIKKLLESGYRVRTTVRSYPDSKKDLGYLTNLPGASEKLEIFSADLAEPESFEPVIQGCIGVFHVAHPIDFEDKEPEEVKTRRSINATLSIMKACLDSGSVKKFVYTSSASAVAFSDKDVDVLDENDWSDIDYLRSSNIFGASYMISKTLTEKAVVEFSQTHRLDFVSVIPTFIHGPFICPRVPGSVYTSMAMIFGNKDQYTPLVKASMVHVDDVCSAHIFLFEKPGTKGRYICSAVDITIEKLSEFLSARYPEYPMPTPDSLKEVERLTYPYLSSKKLLDTGFEYKYGLEEMYDEAIRCCKVKGVL